MSCYSHQDSIDHKHCRRKRPPPVQSVVIDSIAAATTTSLLSPPPPPLVSGIVHQLKFKLTALTLVVIVKTLSLALLLSHVCHAQQQLPTSQQNSYLLPNHRMDNLNISELLPVGTIVHQLKAVDRSNENRKITYALTGDTFSVDEETGEVRLMKQLDRERQSVITTVVNVLGSNSDQPLESKRRTIFIEDADDSWPIFQQHKSSVINNSALGQYSYQVDVSEQAPVGATLLSELFVVDADEGSNADIVFECRPRQSTNLACEHFALYPRRLQSGKYSITVKTRQPLDYERLQSYKLSLIARGTRPSPLKGAPLEAEAIINIKVINVQDEGPVFVNAPYSLSMPEGLESGQRLLKLIVQDGDLAQQRDLSVIVTDELFKDYFHVVRDPEMSKIWYLITNKTIDREDPRISGAGGNMFTINLLAAELNEQGEPVASEQELYAALKDQWYNKTLLKRETVSVIVIDLPDTVPQFVHSTTNKQIDNNHLVVNVSESLPTGSSVPNLDLTVLDLDQGVNSRFKLTLVDGEIGPLASEAFALENQLIHGKSEVVLNVLNSTLLDYENASKRVYRFSLIASKLSADNSPALEQKIDIQVNIVDANDEWPEFERDQYVLSVPEGSPPGYHVATIKAKDRDSGSFGRVSHMLIGHGASKFKVISEAGKITVGDCVVAQCLDYEVQSSYSLTYEARDGGGHKRNVSVIINVVDINDHAPKFLESVYKRELISDNLSSKQNYISPQLIVRARDDDGPTQGRNNITYRIRSSNLTGLDVEPSSGLVYISQPLDLDSLISKMHQHQQASSAASSLSHRRITFEAEIVADDNGSPPLNSSATIVLMVKGNRDGAPQFKQDTYMAYVHENQAVSKPFFQVQAYDPDDKDSQLRYSLGFDFNDLISIEAQSGQLSFKNKVDYDDFKGVPYNVTVYATDNSRPFPLRAAAIVSILIQDVNNKQPKFDNNEYKSVLIQGKTKPGDVILQVSAIDLDLNSRLNYSILYEQLSINDRNGQHFKLDDIVNSTSGYLAQISRQERIKLANDFKRLFSINQRTGAIELKAEPDYSFATLITLKVRVVDLNQEIFTQSGELQEDFVNCVIFLQTHIDKSPIFAPPWSIDRRDYNISIMEELPSETVIFSLLAKDPQTSAKIDMFEKVTESDPLNYFRVDRSGLVIIHRRIDYEELAPPKRMSLSVKAVTGDGLSSIANLNIQIVDLNDNAPQFRNQSYTVSVSESVASGQEILTVSADDRDSGEFNQVYYSLGGFSSELFAIHARKGAISIRKGFRLDRDVESSYYLIATASDCNETAVSKFNYHSNNNINNHHDQSAHLIGGGGSGTGQSTCKKTSVPIEITVTDENDNDPVFLNANKRGEYEATTSETVSINSVIIQIVAKDVDEGANGQVAYEIVPGVDDRLSKLFKIDAEGYISATGSLSGLGRSAPYKITLRAYDMGKQSRQAYTTLLLTIVDVVANDGVPKFIRPKPDELVTLPESAGPSTFVYQVQAVDPDEDGKLKYKFLQPSDTFDIDPFEGIIKTQSRKNFYLDREIVPNYTLIIVAQDYGKPSKQAHQVLTIKITDINDNEPYFERDIDDPPIVLAVDEEVPKDTLIGTILAIDRDVGSNALIGYEIIDGNQNNLFRLNWESDNQTSLPLDGNNPCQIYSTGRLDREVRDSYTLTIKATSMSKMRNQLLHLRDPLGGRNPFNHYNASDLSKIRVTIKLVDINDNRPVFVEQRAKSVVDSSAEVYSQLMVLKAIDVDSSSSPIQYSILDAFYFSDSKFKPSEDITGAKSSTNHNNNNNNRIQYGRKDHMYSSMKYVFDIHAKTGILRNSVSLRPFTDGYFEIFIKAESGQGNSQQQGLIEASLGQTANFNGKSQQDGLSAALIMPNNKCHDSTLSKRGTTNDSISLPSGIDVSENCFVAVTRAVVFVTHQRETFKFVFNKTKLNDRIDEFKDKIQHALEDIMFESVQVQASLGDSKSSSADTQAPVRAEKVFLNTFNTDFYEREDGSLDFSTITSCSQLVKFDDRSYSSSDNYNNDNNGRQYSEDSQATVPNQVVNYDDVLNLLKTLNATQLRQQKPSIFSQYGLVKIERCLPDKTMYKMTLFERLALYFAAIIALVSILLALIVSKMRKSYEKNLKLLQRSKYQYMGTPYA